MSCCSLLLFVAVVAEIVKLKNWWCMPKPALLLRLGFACARCCPSPRPQGYPRGRWVGSDDPPHDFRDRPRIFPEESPGELGGSTPDDNWFYWLCFLFDLSLIVRHEKVAKMWAARVPHPACKLIQLMTCWWLAHLANETVTIDTFIYIYHV